MKGAKGLKESQGLGEEKDPKMVAHITCDCQLQNIIPGNRFQWQSVGALHLECSTGAVELGSEG